MNVVGIEQADWHDDHVHTIDLWYSGRRRCWIVERLNNDGHLIGTTHCCPTREDAEDCLAEWLRSHDEAHMTSHRDRAAAEDKHAAAKDKMAQSDQDDTKRSIRRAA